MNLVLASPPYNTGIAWRRSDFAHDVFSKRSMENAVRVMGSVMALAAHGHTFCSYLVLPHLNRSFCTAKGEVEVVHGDLEKKKEKMSDVIEVEDHALLYIKRPVNLQF